MDYAEEEELSEDEDWSAPLGDTEAALDTEPSAGTLGDLRCQEPEVYHTGENGAVNANPDSVKKPMLSTAEPTNENGLMSRMQLNDHKAGMQGLDRERINKIIYEASKGSRFYENEMKKENQMTARIEEQQSRLALLTPEQVKAGVHEADIILRSLENSRKMGKTIVHVDMDAFYAAVEMRDNPALRNVPMAVGGNSMLSTSNYIARRFGVRAAMPGFIGRKLCPDLVIVPTNFDKYTAVSKQIREVMADYDPNFCPMSLDEAYLDITEHLKKRQSFTQEERTYWTMLKVEDTCRCDRNILKTKRADAKAADHGKENTRIGGEKPEGADNQDACDVCGLPRDISCGRKETFGLAAEEAVREMRARMHWKTQLTASAGIGPNTMLAKVCSDQNKPNGQYYLTPTKEAVLDFVRHLDIRKVSGIGKVAERMLRSLEVKTCADLYTKRGVLYHLYSETSLHYFLRISIGIGSTTVERDGERKSMSVERTFAEIHDPKELYQKCQELSNSLSEDLNDEQLVGKTVGIKLKTVKFDLMTRAQTLLNYTSDAEQIYGAAHELLKTEILQCQPEPLRLRLMGVRMSNLLPKKAVGDQKQSTITSLLSKMKSKTVTQDTAGDPRPCTSQASNKREQTQTEGDKIDENSNQTNPKTQGKTSWLRSGRAAKPAKTFLCPVCSENVVVPDLDCFNRHVDECLSGGPKSKVDESSVPSKDLCVQTDYITNSKLDRTCGKEDIRNFGVPSLTEIKESGPTDVSIIKVSNLCKEHDSVPEVESGSVNMSVRNEPIIEQIDETQNVCENQDEPGVGENVKLTVSDPPDRHTTQHNLNKELGQKQKRDLPTLETKNTAGRSASTESQKSQKPTCPICNKQQHTFNLILFNKHVDDCLKRGITDEPTSVAGPSCSSTKDPPPCMDESSDRKKGPFTQMGGKQNFKSESQNTDRKHQLGGDAASGQGEGDLVDKVMACPVCDLRQEWVSLEAFSRHVDACLNRATIKEMLQNDPSPQTKRQLPSPPEEPPSKRKKVVGKGIQRIDSFFK